MTAPAALEANARANRWLRRLGLITAIYVALVVTAALVVAGFAQYSLLHVARQSHDIAVENHGNGEQIKQTLSAVLSVTGPDAQARQAAGTIDILKRNAVELDCRSRRQQARLAAPDPARPCVDQTPVDVFPGVDGQPARRP